MNLKPVLFSFVAFSFILACTHTKKTSKTDSTHIEEPSVSLDTIKVVADEPQKKEIYQATNTKLSDIIHTKLWVSFDWQKSQLIGKAELQVKPYFYPTLMLYLNARGMEIKSVKLAEKEVKELPIKKGVKSVVVEDVFIDKPVTYKY